VHFISIKPVLSDHLSYVTKRDNSGDRVVVLGQDGEVRGIYCGCGKASDVKAVDLVVTELDNIIVLDIYSGLHVKHYDNYRWLL
jgi:hypothetical protein